ncbi:MAG: hypothetical protein JOZ17_16595 [Acetobacteraceae bacterium]|nr:hypothetical protein [Acetobacteraceae bacterium]
MTKTPMVIAAASGLALIIGAGTSLAQSSGTQGSDQLKHAQGPDTGKAKTSPKMTQVPGSSTTGNATAPAGGGNSPAQGAGTGKATGTGSAESHTQ